jgi:hypothetical protein
MIVSINQPAYLPWLGYFDRIARSDLHIVLDHVQFEKGSFTSRNKILTAGGPVWLSVPVKTKGLCGLVTIKELEIDNLKDWRKSHWQSIKQTYSKASFFNEYGAEIEKVYAHEFHGLCQLNWELTSLLVRFLDIKTPLVRSSEMTARGCKDALVLALCEEAKATTYLSGPLGRDYLNPEDFASRGLGLQYHDYKHPTYGQNHLKRKLNATRSFEPYMCILDLLFNEGPESLKILTNRSM